MLSLLQCRSNGSIAYRRHHYHYHLPIIIVRNMTSNCMRPRFRLYCRPLLVEALVGWLYDLIKQRHTRCNANGCIYLVNCLKLILIVQSTIVRWSILLTAAPSRKLCCQYDRDDPWRLTRTTTTVSYYLHHTMSVPANDGQRCLKRRTGQSSGVTPRIGAGKT